MSEQNEKPKHPISYHIFMFPFKWDYHDCFTHSKGSFYDIPLNERLNINKINMILQNNNWIYEPFKINEASDYNENLYFYEYVRDAIYNTDDFNKNQISYFYNYKFSENANPKYSIKVKKEKEKTVNIKHFELDIESISLKLFETGVGILNFRLKNNRYNSPNDILLINDYGRRIYPQFLGEGFDISVTKNAFLADSISILQTDKDNIEETFNYDTIKGTSVKNNQDPTYIPKFIIELLGHEFTNKINEIKPGQVLINPIVDDRMFVTCWYANKYLLHELCTYNKDKDEYTYLENDIWYKLLFIDTENKTCQNKKMEKELINNATYGRWIDYSTLYGITRYSFILIMNSIEKYNEFVFTNFKSMYFQMVLLCIAQRASILRFSNEVTIASSLNSNNNHQKDLDRINKVYEGYIRFVNKIYFREITAQEQGIEIYKIMQKEMNIDRDIKDLNNEIQDLHNYAMQISNKTTQDYLNKLTKISGYLLVPSLIAGILGMNAMDDKSFGGWSISLGLLIGLSIIGIRIVYRYINKKTRR